MHSIVPGAKGGENRIYIQIREREKGAPHWVEEPLLANLKRFPLAKDKQFELQQE